MINRLKQSESLVNLSGQKSARLSLWRYFNPNTEQALNKIEAWMNSCSTGESFAVCIIHIENMAEVLFTFGEEVSIESTEKVQELIISELDIDSQTIHVGIDEFIFVSKIESVEIYNNTIKSILKKIRAFGAIYQTTPLFFACKAGSTIATHEEKINTCLDQAFIALYECRHNSGHEHYLYSDITNHLENYKKQMAMASTLQNAFHTNKLRLAFQPIINAKTGHIKSYEALLRVIMPDGEIITAGPFIQIAETYGFIDQIDYFVFDLVTKELELNKDVVLGLNFSTNSIESDDFLNHAEAILKQTDIANRLIIEITETGIVSNMARIVEFVERFQALGCKIAIDDFGAGYTSFTQLKQLNPDILKIDGIFVRDIVDNHDNQLFVKTLVDIAKAFGIKTTAEFVENGVVAKTLIELGVDYLQGYYFGKPMNYRPWITDDKV